MEIKPNDFVLLLKEGGGMEIGIPDELVADPDNTVPEHVLLGTAISIALTDPEWVAEMVDWVVNEIDMIFLTEGKDDQATDCG